MISWWSQRPSLVYLVMRCKRGQRREECGKHCSVVSDDDECDDDDDDENVDHAPTPSSIR
jgi:hypothetical protein